MKSLLSTVESALFIAICLTLWFVCSGDPSLIEIWHTNAVTHAKQGCGVSK